MISGFCLYVLPHWQSDRQTLTCEKLSTTHTSWFQRVCSSNLTCSTWSTTHFMIPKGACRFHPRDINAITVPPLPVWFCPLHTSRFQRVPTRYFGLSGPRLSHPYVRCCLSRISWLQRASIQCFILSDIKTVNIINCLVVSITPSKTLESVYRM